MTCAVRAWSADRARCRRRCRRRRYAPAAGVSRRHDPVAQHRQQPAIGLVERREDGAQRLIEAHMPAPQRCVARERRVEIGWCRQAPATRRERRAAPCWRPGRAADWRHGRNRRSPPRARRSGAQSYDASSARASAARHRRSGRAAARSPATAHGRAPSRRSSAAVLPGVVIVRFDAPEEGGELFAVRCALADRQHADHRRSRARSVAQAYGRETVRQARAGSPTARHRAGRRAGRRDTRRPSGERTPSASTTQSNGPARRLPAIVRHGRPSAAYSMPVMSCPVSIGIGRRCTAANSGSNSAARCTARPE